ncbi:MAG TPA: PQQ-binding-like beta-propeller repeat protein [Draconibacterium sp.]|nr:PQQ-binding-like beta-propeller repeat protein [Draconibacterium sp.]
MKQKHSIIIGFVLIFYVLRVSAQDWPDWRGANRDGVWNETGVVEKFDADSLPAVWLVSVGAGYSGPTVVNGKVYLTDRLEKPEPTEGVLCFDEQTGEKIWEYRYNCEYEGVGYPAGPRASVVINNGKAYSLGTMGNLFCFDADNGNIVWQRDLNHDYKIRMPIWGIAATPLITGDKVVLQISGSDNACVVALDKNTGKEVWRNLDDMASYSAPVLISQANKKVVVVWTEDSLAGLDPGTGKVYWRIPWKIKMGMGISTPVLYQNYIFVSCFYSGSLLVKLGENSLTAEKVWQRCGESERNTDALHCVINTPVIMDDYIYGVDSYGELRCLELKTGDRVWENLTAVHKNRWANIHFIQHENKTWMFNEQGELIISELNPLGFHEISRTKIIKPTKKQLPRGVTWSHPAFANRHVFARNDNRLICVDVSKKQ